MTTHITPSIIVQVNGKPHQIPEQETLGSLLHRLGISDKGTAVEVAGNIVPVVRFESTILVDGQSIEIVQMLGGG